eukprot:43845-Eustigmatos_ZCMA.PRE.1
MGGLRRGTLWNACTLGAKREWRSQHGGGGERGLQIELEMLQEKLRRNGKGIAGADQAMPTSVFERRAQ